VSGESDKQNQHLSPEHTGMFLKLQEREIDVREGEISLKRDELDLNKQKDTNQLSYAKEALKTEAADREKIRIHNARLQRRRMWFTFGLVFIALIFLGYLVSIGEKQTAKDLITLAVTISAVSFGGYFFGKSKSNDK